MSEGFDVIKNPEHYVTDASGIEAHELYRCYPGMVAQLLKYVWRHEKKGERQSIAKALWYAEHSESWEWEALKPDALALLHTVAERTKNKLLAEVAARLSIVHWIPPTKRARVIELLRAEL